MNVGKIIKYGVFNSKKDYANVKVTPLRTVRYFEFDFILSCDDRATSYVDKKSCALAPDALVVRKPGQKSNSRLHFKCYCLHLEVERGNPLWDELSALPDFYRFINGETYRTLFETLFKHLIKQTDAENDYFTLAKILELAYHLKKDARQNEKVDKLPVKRETESVQKVVSYLKKNYQDKISLQTLGEKVGYSPNHLQRIFTNVTGVSPQTYLENVRIGQAKYLLSKEENSLADVAYACGFSSQSYFSKIFKKHTLLTPCEFRKNAAFSYDEND